MSTVDDFLAIIQDYRTEESKIKTRREEAIAELNRQFDEEGKASKIKFDEAKQGLEDTLKGLGLGDILSNLTGKAPAKAKGKQPNLFDSADAKKERKPRTSSDDLKATLERNKATYTSTYELGIDEKTGFPKRFKGRGKKNVDIKAQMEADEAKAALAK